MKSRLSLIIFSLASLILLILHTSLPNFNLDSISVLLLLLIFLPWIFPYLKKLELPGGIKIELREVKEATEKIGRTINLSGKIEAKSLTSDVELNVIPTDSISMLRRVAIYEPNLALVGFRIEIEKIILSFAEKNKISVDRPLVKLIKELHRNGILANDAASGLIELVNFGNQAAHGAKVSDEAVNWVLDYGPQILASLDDNPK